MTLEYTPTDMSSEKRGCGSRSEGSVYLEVQLSDGPGIPISEFLLCEPMTLGDLTVNAVGITLIQDPATEVWHIFDHVGAEHYPSLADFVEESFHLGVSRKVPTNIEFSKLTRDSRLFLIHPKARVVNNADMPERILSCPKGVHATDDVCECLAHGWENVEPTENDFNDDGEKGQVNEDGTFRRTMANGARFTARKNQGEVKTVYEPGAFYCLPISGMAYIDSEDEEHNQEILDRLSESELPYGVTPG